MPDHGSRRVRLHGDAPSGRRRRPVAVWGADELFERPARRRRFQPAESGEGGQGGEGGRTIVVTGPFGERVLGGDGVRWEDLEPDAGQAHVWADEEPADERSAASWDDVDAEAALDEIDHGRSQAWDVLADEPPAGEADAGADAVHPTDTRRTVVVTGRPGHLGVPRADLERRRPPRTVAERLGGSPDRVVGWAVGLGFILILIAILTAGGA
jgi:hypothetical protein